MARLDDEEINSFDAELSEIRKLQQSEVYISDINNTGTPHSSSSSSHTIKNANNNLSNTEGEGNEEMNINNNVTNDEKNAYNASTMNDVSIVGMEEIYGGGGSGIEQDDVDARSVYVGNVDYSSTPHDLQDHFKSCGQINRITIMVDKYTGHPKGFAYIEFSEEDAVQNAVLLSDTFFKGRQIKVNPKRKNLPGYTRARGLQRARMGLRGGSYRGRVRGMYRPYYRPRGMRGAFIRPY